MIAILIYFGIAVAYVFFFAIASKFYKKGSAKKGLDIENINFLFMVPAYKEDAVIIETAKNIISQPDFGSKDEVVIIADQLKPETITHLEELKVTVIEVFFEKSTKAKAINSAMKSLESWGRKYNAVVLLDADNHLVEGYITKTKESYVSGNQIIQTHRIAKNLDTTMAKLDAISEEINNSIFRLGHHNVGLSAALIGSGLVMNYDLFVSYLRKIDVVSGFDKQLELDVMKDKLLIEYLEEAYVLDEKVRNTQVFETQRTRWLAAQWNFAKQNFLSAWVELFKNGNVDFFNKVIQFVLPPRLILVGVLGLMLIFSLIFPAYLTEIISLNALLWAGLLIATPTYLLKMLNMKVLLELPKVFFSMLKAILKIGKAKQKFLHTPHGA
ncbi:glycosyl transferase family 2 [Emticicia oligotrophica DSM 17448]|uniref:Glycosyl transferase family 2 n=1 Tax=Emticicia oligotrophica (strain DSM 17448 / CIP 109782 / MTCC 6937 / GPTSA100-15) TaxID=929562 RepID=A0ABM5N680_EMTOG|nr:glycosyltransferase family 2 protein [Emticicia oligotrophica]AFK04961.1 glycosyl transferase family 2 [Emticicia oligotrophica DSM 17448]